MFKSVLTTLFLVVFALPGISFGKVSATVYLLDSNTPIEWMDPNFPYIYRDIMVGTKLSIIVDSNTEGFWSGGLILNNDDREFGTLAGRDFNNVTNDWEGSHFEAAGEMARVSRLENQGMMGFRLLGDFDAVPGDWFIIDYNSLKAGICDVEFWDFKENTFEPVYNLIFSHVPTRDFNNDNIVNFADFAQFVSCWQQNELDDSDLCKTTDLNQNGKVEIDDLWLFTEYWLERTE